VVEALKETVKLKVVMSSTMNKSYKYVRNRKKHERSFFMFRYQLGGMTIKNQEKKGSKS
jgi:hypothetical protein